VYETVINSNKTEELCYVLGFDSYFTVDRVNVVVAMWLCVGIIQ